MEGEVRAWAKERVSAFVEQRGGECIEPIANPIPVMVMARLAGLPVDDVQQLLQWAFSGGDILAGTLDLAAMAELGSHTAQLAEYLRTHFALTEKRLAEHPQQISASVLDELVRGVQQGFIREDAAISILIVLVGAAGESTSSLVGSAIRLLAQDETLQQQLREQPQLIERFVEEVVRLESPFKGHYRAVNRATTLGGVTIPEGARLFLLWAAANRDPNVFAKPDTLDINRTDSKEHLGFGHGIHFCIGARIARLETRIILEELLVQTAQFSLDPAYSLRHVPSIFVRRLAQMYLVVKPSS